MQVQTMSSELVSVVSQEAGLGKATRTEREHHKKRKSGANITSTPIALCVLIQKISCMLHIASIQSLLKYLE